MKYTFVQATEKNWELYKGIRLETLEQEPQAFSSTYKDALTYPDSKWKEVLNDNQSVYLLVFKDTDVVGVGRITFNDPNELSNTAVLGGIYINKIHRNCGIGRTLIQHLITLARQKESIKEIKLEVKKTQINAISLYTKLGFENSDEIDGEMVMKKILS